MYNPKTVRGRALASVVRRIFLWYVRDIFSCAPRESKLSISYSLFNELVQKAGLVLVSDATKIEKFIIQKPHLLPKTQIRLKIYSH